MSVRREMRTAFAEGPGAVARLLGSIPGSPQGAFKARTIAVGILLDCGVDDWQTLSLVNRVSDDAPLIAALKQALPDVKAQKAVSVFLNQMTSSLFSYPQNHLRYPPADGQQNAEDVSGRKGAEKIVNRDMNTGFYEMSIGDPNEYILEVKTSDDGRAATVVVTVRSSLSMGTGVDSRDTFGTFTLNVALDFDLTQENPSITDVRLAQTID